ncbi:MAG: formylglycine-generating enzyme family protein [Planctomycetia bacterium]|jgi:formylglycine-generating enzyme required for sulfatase activity
MARPILAAFFLTLLAAGGPATHAQPAAPPPRPAAAPGFTNSVGMRLVAIPAGEFTMGDKEWHYNQPHPVRITKPFHLGATLVTQAQYETVTGKNPSIHKEGDGAVLPVDSICWRAAQEFCRKLNALPEEQRAGRTYRLPTEAEWEYACRAGTATKFWYGNNRDATKMNFIESKIGRPTPVERYPANPWGLHDMHGNLYQPCLDAYDVEQFPHHLPTDDPVRPEGTHRVFRGGAYSDIPRRCQAAYRGRNETMIGPQLQRPYFGLRVACDVQPAP